MIHNSELYMASSSGSPKGQGNGGIGEIDHCSYISFSFSKSSKSLKRPTAFFDVRKVFILIKRIGRASSIKIWLKLYASSKSHAFSAVKISIDTGGRP